MSRVLRGLPGLNTISEQERNQFMLNNEDRLRKYRTAGQRRQAAEILYNNIQFRNAFGDDGFEKAKAVGLDLEGRNKLLENKIVIDKAKEVFGNDADFFSLSSQLDTQGWKDLLASDYLGTQERAKRLSSSINAAKKVGPSYDAAINNPYIDALGVGFMQIGKTAAAQQPYNQDADYAKRDKEIREKLFAETQQRREDETQSITNSIYASMLDADNEGVKSLGAFYNEFDKLASGKDADGVPYSPHYATFKNSEWLKDYTHEDRLKDYARYQALKQQYGEGVARQYLDRTIQNKVAEAQDGSWTGNTLKKIFTTVWSDLGSNIALVNYIGKSPEEIGLLNEGKDPSKPIYDERGNIVDYKKSDAVWTNPAYWNNVYKYNTFSPTEIKAIEERGGISEDVNVREYGHVPDFFSWETVQEGISQAGHLAAFGLESYLTGNLGKVVGKVGKLTMEGLGVGTKTMAKASKVGNITNDLFVTFAGSASGAQMEAMGTFEEQMQAAKERIEEQKRKELQEYYNTIDYETPEAKEAIASYFEQLKRQDRRRVATGSSDGGRIPIPQSDEHLMQQAQQQYVNQLMEAKQEELEELHRVDLNAARRAATKAYGTNFFMDWVKDGPFDLALRKFQYAKGSLTGAFDNAIERNILTDAATGGVKRGKRLTSAKNVAKEFGKEIGGNFADEYIDGLNSSFAGGIGNNDFENYINKTYNPELYNAVTEGFLGNLIAGFSAGVDGLTDRNNLYEGFIGATSAGSSVMVNPNAVFYPKDTWKAVVGGVDATGNKLSRVERLTSVLNNPLLSTYAELAKKDRAIDNTVEAINQVVSANKDKLSDAAKILAAVDDYSSPMQRFRFVNSEDEEDSGMASQATEEDISTVSSPSLLDSQDQKLYNAFTLMETLTTLNNIQGGSQSALYQQAMEKIQGLANGTLSEEEQAEEIDSFLAEPENKSVLDDPNGREIAAERLQKNAQYLLDTQQKIGEVRSMLDKNPGMKGVDGKVKTLLTYNLVAKDDYQKRLETLEKELGGTSHTDPEVLFTPDFAARYGTVKAAENAVAARDREIAKIRKEKEEIKKDIETAQKKGQEALVKSRQFQLSSLEEREQAVQEEKEEITGLISQTTEGNEEAKGKGKLETVQFTEDYILGLDARDKAEVFNPANKNNYTKKQQKVIEHVRKKLMQQDPSAMQKVHDAGVLANRIADLNTVQDKLMQNSELAATYLDAVEQRRTALAMAESIQEGINQHYGKIEKAYNNLYGRKPRNVAKRQQEFKNAVMATNSAVIRAYIEDHPEQANEVQPLLDLLDFEEDAQSIVMNGEGTKEEKLSQLATLMNMEKQVNSKEEAQKYLEGIVDSPDIDDVTKGRVNILLDKMEKLGHQRDATVVESRKQQKEREEAAKQKVEEEKKKTEKAAEDAAEKAVAEAQAAVATSNPTPSATSEAAVRQAQEEAKRQAEGAKPLAGNDAADGVPVVAPQINVEEEVKRDNNIIINEEEAEPVKISWTSASSLMKDDGEDGPMETGEMWSGTPQNPQKGEFVVNRETKNGKPVITFGLQQPGFDVQKPETLTVTSEEYEAAVPQQSTKQEVNGRSLDNYLDIIRSLPNKELNNGLDYRTASRIREEIKNGTSHTRKEYDNLSEEELRRRLDHEINNIEEGREWLAERRKESEGELGGDALRGPLTQIEIATKNARQYLSALYKKQQERDGSEGESSGTGAEEKRDFNVKSIEKKDDGWYFNGTFAGETEKKQVKASDNFDLDAAIDRQKAVREAALAAQGVTTDNTHLEDTGEDVQGKAPSLEEQIAEAGMKGKIQVEDTNALEDAASTNGIEEQSENHRPTTLSGNAMSEWEMKDLIEDGVLKHKKGEKNNDSMEKYYAWMNAAGIKLQNIIDQELGEILRKNPDAKVKFMAVRPQPNATKDGDVKTHLFLVLDYDNKINKGITSIHDDANGGVITSNGKKYLIIGTVGYPNGNIAKRQLRDVLFTNDPSSGKKMGIGGSHYGLVKQGSGAFFDAHPEERFWVPEHLSTEIVPHSLIPGYIVNQQEGDEGRQYRKVSELLKGDRNPLGYHSLEDLGWMIQERTKFVAIGADKSRVMSPGNVERNAGSAFVLVPAGNGKFVPSYIKPLFYREMNDGELKQTIDRLLGDLTSPNYAQRYQAVIELSKIFYFDEEGKNILVGKDKSRHANQITLKDSEQSMTFTLDGNFDRVTFMQAMESFNPRINITASVLMNPRSLKIYDEAGALQTDIAQLATAGSSYSIYALDVNGDMMKPASAPEMPVRAADNSNFREGGASQIVYNGKYYRETDGTFYINGIPVTDENLIKELQYNQRVANGELESVETKGEWDSYLTGTKDNPQGIKINKNTKKVKEMTAQEALDLMEKIEKEKARKEREQAAKTEKQRFDAQDGEPTGEYEPVDIEFDFNDETGELVSREDKKAQEEAQKQEEAAKKDSQPANKDNTHKSVTELEGKQSGSTQTFGTLVKNKQYRKQVIETIKAKWPDAPSKIADLEEFLKGKNVEIGVIGTDESSIQAWITTLKDCR